MDGLELFSSRRFPKGGSLGSEFLVPELSGASSYKRIAGYFCASIIDVAGNELDGIIARKGAVQVVCNARLDFVENETMSVSESALDEFLWQEWVSFKRERVANVDCLRFGRLHRLMKDGRMEVRVICDGALGLLHGKAGLIEKNGVKKAFLGSANESLGGWNRNYELLAASESLQLVDFVASEFDELWQMARPLPKKIVDDFGRLANRVEIGLDQWRAAPDPGHVLSDSGAGEITPMDYQKWFIDLAFRDHKAYPWGARYVLADPVGLGKTIQMGLAMKLMALWSKTNAPLLAVVPKTLVMQWQEELLRMGIPSAYWDNVKKQWFAEDGSVSGKGKASGDVPNCPRRVGIVSSGLVARKNKMRDWLLARVYECVIVDEAHRARRHIISSSPYAKGRLGEQRNLIRFLREVSRKTRSMIMGTATPIQVHPIEAWDLLDVLAQGNEAVLGNDFSRWSASPERAIQFLSSDPVGGPASIKDVKERWEWLRNPLPFPRLKSKGIAPGDLPFRAIRDLLGLSNPKNTVPVGPEGNPNSDANLAGISAHIPGIWGDPVRTPESSVLRHTPFVRRIIRRSRDELERLGHLRRIGIDLRGDANPLPSPDYLKQAFEIAQDFCKTLTDMPKGFIHTLLLRRLGSSKKAGLLTAQRMLDEWDSIDLEDWESDDEEDDSAVSVCSKANPGKPGRRELSVSQRALLEEFCSVIESGQVDPKFKKLHELFASGDSESLNGSDGSWLTDGVIVFSQYYDTAEHFARMTSAAFPEELVAIYAGAGRSMLLHGAAGVAQSIDRERIKGMAKSGELRIIFGTDAASEGLDLQMLGCLVNLDLPWNPTRLEQRKGRIQRPGQRLDRIRLYNMRYEGSVEDRVHARLSERLQEICSLLGQVPDCLERAWILEAQGKKVEADTLIHGVEATNPLQDFYDNEIAQEKVDWDEVGTILKEEDVFRALQAPWQ